MATLPKIHKTDRLPLIVGFQPISANTPEQTRVIERGEGIYVYDSTGKEYIEATASFYVASLGYQNEELIEAIERQYRDLPFFVSGLNRTSATSIELAEKLVQMVPIENAHIMFASTGSEANDFLVKLYRFAAIAKGEKNRTTMISRYSSYHGGTLATASLTGSHHEEFGLPLEGFKHISQPDYHGDRKPGETEQEFSMRLAKELEDLIHSEPPNSIAALFAEPISFSAGFKPPPQGYFEAIKNVLDAHGIELVADEVVTGVGRTGKFWGSDTLGLSPNNLTMGKGITSGYFPMSAIAIGEHLYEHLEIGSDKVGTLAHAGTFSAHPVGTAAGLKALEIIARDKLVSHGVEMGQRLSEGLAPFSEHPAVGEVRSEGLGASIDFLVRDENDRTPNDNADENCMKVYNDLLDKGVVTRPAGRSVVIAPPLIIQPQEVDDIVERIGESLNCIEP